MTVSSSATTSLEDIATAGGPTMKRWFQLSLSSRKVNGLPLGWVPGIGRTHDHEALADILASLSLFALVLDWY